MKIVYWLSRISPRSMKIFAVRKLPIYALLLLVLIVYGVKGMTITLFLGLFFFLGWTFKGMYQAFQDWRLTQRLNRVHFSAVEYEGIKRENDMLHEALNAFKDNGKRNGGLGRRDDAHAPRPSRSAMDHESIREMILQLREE